MRVCVCVCVCVRERERERERLSHRRTLAPTHLILDIDIGRVCKQDFHRFAMAVIACYQNRRITVLHSSAVCTQTMSARERHAACENQYMVLIVRASASVSVDLSSVCVCVQM